MKDGLQPINTDLTELFKMVQTTQQTNNYNEYYTQEQLIYILQQQLYQQQLQQQYQQMLQLQQNNIQQLQSTDSLPSQNLSSSSTPSSSQTTIQGLDEQKQQYISRRFIIGGFGSNGYDSSSYAMEYLYDRLGENNEFEFNEQVKQSWQDIDSYISDLKEDIKQNEKQGIETIYIHFAVNHTPFIRLEKSAYNNKSFILPELSCPPNTDQSNHTINLNLPHNQQIQSALSLQYINTFLRNNDQYWTTESINPGQNSNNYLYFQALQATNNKALLINLPSLLNENKDNIALFLNDFVSSLL